MIQGQVDRDEDFRRNFVTFVVSTCLHENQRGEVNYLILNAVVDLNKEFVIGFRGGYLENTLDKMTVTDEEENVNEDKCRNKSVKDEAKDKDQTRVSKFKSTAGGSHNKIGGVDSLARTPLKRVRKDVPEKSKSRTPVLSQDSYEIEGFLMEIDTLEKHFMGS
ncbi:hypothetical protein Cgig2_010065 [Carnegiea gigantea]|uniref:Uncharacterized protein n=1 Tax=Carnegiea gigantea TaxID=171969 RepID=A0A9Q1JUJ0_9CARY|nr:hypothetical protein Cgig2_010065 [Carnegiea gigantea]